MNAVSEITDLLLNAGVTATAGKYAGTVATEVSVVFGNGESVKKTYVLGSVKPILESELVRVKICGDSYRDMESMAAAVKGVAVNGGFIQVGGITDMDDTSSGKMQIALDFKALKKQVI